MAKAKFSPAEWELVKDAPLWVNAALASSDKKGMAGTSRREVEAVEKTLQGYRSSNALIREIIADDSEPAEALKKVTKAEADVALGRIASIVESKLGADDLDELNELLLLVGRNVAAAASENPLGLGEKVSKYETATLKELEVVLRATDAQKKARRDQAQSAQAKQAAEARAAAEAKAKAEQQKRETEAKAKADQDKREAEAEAKQSKKEAEERLEKARQEAEERREASAKAKQEAEAKERLEKARQEAEARQREAQAQREARERAEAEAKAKEEQARAEATAKANAQKEAAAAPRFTEFIAEHTVVAGDNLSFISQKYYGHQGNFRLIYEANKEVIGDNMSLIRPGQKLRIPKL